MDIETEYNLRGYIGTGRRVHALRRTGSLYWSLCALIKKEWWVKLIGTVEDATPITCKTCLRRLSKEETHASG